MTRRPVGPQAQVALIAALIFVVVGLALTGVLVIGLLDGITGPGPLIVGALAIGVFALGVRLFLLSRATKAPPASLPRQAAPPARRTRPQPRPKGRPARM